MPWPRLNWRRSDVALGVLLVGLGYLVAIALIVAVVGLSDTDVDESPVLVGAVATAVFELWLAVVVVLLARRRGITAADLGFEVPQAWRYVAIGLLGAWGILIVYTGIVIVIAELVGSDLAWLREGNALDLPDSPTVAVWITLGIGIVVIAPLSEELFFRGFLFRAVEAFSHPWVAVAVSGLAFGLVHLNVSVLLPFWAIGALFAWIYRVTGSIWTPIVTHAIFNGVSFAVTVAGAAS